MSRYKLQLKPQGAIARDTSLTIQMQPLSKTIAPTVDATTTCVLGIATLSPAATDAESFVVVFTSEIQTVDLNVTVALVAPGVPLQIAFLSGGTFNAASVVAIIPAGSDFVVVPFLAGSVATGGTPLTITATSASCGTASVDLDLGALACARVIRDLQYRVHVRKLTIAGAAITQVSAIEYRGNLPAGATTTIDSNTVSFDAVDNWTIVEIICAVDGKLCPGDVLTWVLSGTIDLVWTTETTWNAAADENVSQKSVIEAFASPIAPSPFAAGQTIVITAKLNGVLIPLPRATFTITFV